MQYVNLKKAVADYKGRYADEQNLSPKSRKNRRGFTDGLLTFFKDKDFDFSSCREYLDKLRETNDTSSMATKGKDLRAFIKFCFEYEYIEKDFSSKIKLPFVPFKLRDYLVTEDKIIEAIIAGTAPHKFDNDETSSRKKIARMGLLLTLFTGIRNSELRKIRVKDINFVAKHILVHRKGRSIELTILTENMIEPLKEWVKDKESNDFICDVSEESLRNALHKGCRAIGIAPHRVHDLRHIYGLTRLRRGQSPQIVSKLMGHKKLSTFDKYYSHYLIEDLRPAANSSPEIQKSVNTEDVLDSLEQQIKNFGINKDGRFKFMRENGRLVVESSDC